MTSHEHNSPVRQSDDDVPKLEAFIFDMDGTLYQFPAGVKFGQSSLGIEVYKNTISFLIKEFSLPQDEAISFYAELKSGSSEGLSLELEKRYGVGRNHLFNTTWDITPSEHITPEKNLRASLDQIESMKILLSAAPRIWADRALEYMDIYDYFEGRIYTGESDIRKPNPDIFRHILGDCAVRAAHAISIGDQEHSDIIPARQIGMLTLKIGEAATTAADFVAHDVADAINQLKKAQYISDNR